MTAAILTIVVTLLPVFIPLLSRLLGPKKPLTPKETYEANKEWINEAIAKRAERDVNLIVDDAVRRLRESKIRGNSSGSTDH